VPDNDTSRGRGELVRLRGTIDDHEIMLEPPRLEPLPAAEEAEATEMLAALLVTAARRRVGVCRHEEAA
jgi:hypothetical protein